MTLYSETRVQAFLNGDPITSQIQSVSYEIPLIGEEHESAGKFFKPQMVTGIDPMTGEITFTGMPTEIYREIVNFRKVHELQLVSFVRGETATSSDVASVRRVINMNINFTESLSGGERENASPTTYDYSFHIRTVTVKDNGAEILYANAYDETYRVNGQELVDLNF